MASVFGAAGAAATLAASLTVFVVSIDTARAAPSSNVIVVNPTTEPVLTRSVDDPGRIAYQKALPCAVVNNTCSFRFPEVPKNHRLVVQHVSVALTFLADARGAQVTLENGANGASSFFIAPPPFLGSILFDQPVLQYFDAGSPPLVFAEADSRPSGVSRATISGYLLDCATTPCEPIAP
jgi:hypothetical protein